MKEGHFHTLEVLFLGYLGAVIGFQAARFIGAKLATRSNGFSQRLGRSVLALHTLGTAA